MKSILLWFVLAVTFFQLNISFADTQGVSNDHPQFPRMIGAKIVGYVHSGYGESLFHSSMKNRRINLETAEGQQTRIVYHLPKGKSPIEVLRNYQSLFSKLGQVKENFSCRNGVKNCFNNLGKRFIWQKNNRIPVNFENSNRLYISDSYYRSQLYWYGTIESSNSNYTVSLYFATRTGKEHRNPPFPSGDSLLHLEIIENTRS